jgi:hypothetical protein
MFVKFPQNDKYYAWTDHLKSKMIQYFISESKIKSIIKNHDRLEDGIAPETIAVMKRNDRGKRKEEIWVMYLRMKDKINGEKKRIISAWRYPGISPKKEIPIPDDVLEEIDNL